MDDESILALFFARSERAISEAKDKYGRACASVAYRILSSREDSEECVSEALLCAWNAIPPERPAHLRAYLEKITRNRAIMRLRSRQAQKRGGGAYDLALSELRDCVTDGDTPEDALLKRQIGESVSRFLHGQPEEKRVAFVLRYWYFCSTGEIATRLGLREGTVRSMLFRLRKQLKAHLEQEGIL